MLGFHTFFFEINKKEEKKWEKILKIIKCRVQ